jgi:hypothetical protein
MRPVARVLLVSAAVAAAVSAVAPCCSTHDIEVDSKGKVKSLGGGCSGLQPLSNWNPAVNGTSAVDAWWPGGKRMGPSWIAFAGDSETRYEFWRLVKIVGQNQYSVSDNFARVAFNVSANMAKVRGTLWEPGGWLRVGAALVGELHAFCAQLPHVPVACARLRVIRRWRRTRTP